MKRRQPLPSRWLVADERMGQKLWPGLRALRPGSGVLILDRTSRDQRKAALRLLREAAEQAA